MEAMVLSEDLLPGADAAAAYTGLTRRQVYNLVEAGRLPVVKLGRKLFFRKSALDRVFDIPSEAA